MFLYHYYEKSKGLFQNLSDLPIDEAQNILSEIKRTNAVFAAGRYEGYLLRRRELENTVRRIFIKKGGKPVRMAPHYMTLGECEWIRSWYLEGEVLRIPVGEFDLDTVSFTYGDMFPNFSDRVKDNNEYRRNVYNYSGILRIIEKYGMPEGKNKDGSRSPFLYIEAQVWSDDCIKRYKSQTG